jgi:hypothetical protein
MAERLIDVRHITTEKIARSRSWLKAEESAGRFPPAVVKDAGGANLHLESEVDRWLAEFVRVASLPRVDRESALKVFVQDLVAKRTPAADVPLAKTHAGRRTQPRVA